jgi:hypothetical protein
MDEGTGSTALVDITADALIGAGATITGIEAVAAGVDRGLSSSTNWSITFCFDFRESCLLQQLIQRGEIGFE